MTKKDRDDIVSKAKAVNARIAIFQISRGTKDKLWFCRTN